jgi:hypothetical protein
VIIEHEHEHETTPDGSLRHSIFGASIDMLEEKSDGVPLLNITDIIVVRSDLDGRVSIASSISAGDIDQ